MGEVISFMTQTVYGTLRFLALISVVRESKLDQFGVPVVTLFEDNTSGKVMVCSAEDIVSVVGFVRYNNNPVDFKLIWPNAMYYKKFDNLRCGRISNM